MCHGDMQMKKKHEVVNSGATDEGLAFARRCGCQLA